MKIYFKFAYTTILYCLTTILSVTKVLHLYYLIMDSLGFKKYLKGLNWKVLLGIAAFSILCAIVNNLRAPEDKSVEWWGSQDIMEKPEDVL